MCASLYLHYRYLAKFILTGEHLVPVCLFDCVALDKTVGLTNAYPNQWGRLTGKRH